MLAAHACTTCLNALDVVQVLPEQFGLAGTVELAWRRDSLQGEELAERRGDLHNDLDMDNDLPVEQEGRNHVTKEQPQD